MLVQSKLRRDGGTTIEFNGVEYHFTPNDAGDHVAEVTDEAALSRLINEIPEGYCLYGDDAGRKVAKTSAQPPQAHPLEQSKPAKPTNTLLIHDGEGTQIDLMLMDRDALAAFASTELKIVVHKNWKVENLRAKIVEAMRAAAHEELGE